jgi:glycerate dehydrogenase
MKIIVLDGEPLSTGDISWSWLETLGEFTVHARTSPAEVTARINGADAVFTNKVKLTEEHFQSCAELKFIGEMGTGFDNIDVVAAKARGIVVSNVPSYSAAFTAQTTIALLLALCQRIEAHASAVNAGEWVECHDFSMPKFPLVELDGKTLVIFGMGNIGNAVARIAESLGMKVVAAQVPGREGDSSMKHLALDEALPLADVVSLHCPLKPQTRAFVDEGFLTKMKRSAFLINTARGALVDESALAQALQNGTNRRLWQAMS